MKIILASSSAYRQSILKKLHIPFTSVAPDIDESAESKESISTQVQRLAKTKALAIACTLYTSDAADEEDRVDIGSCVLIKKNTQY